LKSFMSSLLLFALMLGGIVLNGRYIEQISDELSGYMTEISPYSDADAKSDDTRKQLIEFFERSWFASRESISFSMTARITEDIDDTFELLKVSFRSGEHAEFDRAREHLLRILSKMPKHEQFRTKNIL